MTTVRLRGDEAIIDRQQMAAKFSAETRDGLSHYSQGALCQMQRVDAILYATARNQYAAAQAERWLPVVASMLNEFVADLAPAYTRQEAIDAIKEALVAVEEGLSDAQGA